MGTIIFGRFVDDETIIFGRFVDDDSIEQRNLVHSQATAVGFSSRAQITQSLSCVEQFCNLNMQYVTLVVITVK